MLRVEAAFEDAHHLYLVQRFSAQGDLWELARAQSACAQVPEQLAAQIMLQARPPPPPPRARRSACALTQEWSATIIAHACR